MSPEDKALLVDSLMSKLEIHVGMCGDGANDCSALKTASVGVSLSEAEASIAAPFTSQVHDISCVVTLLREGKAALTTTFQAFKFLFIYANVEMISSTLLSQFGTYLTDAQFLFLDMLALLPLSIFQTLTGAYDKLTRDMPSAKLFSFPILLSIGVSTCI